MRRLRIKRRYLDAIMRGDKSLEIRVGYGNIKQLRAGDSLMLESGPATGVVHIQDIRVYGTFEEMLDIEPWQDIVPQAATTSEALAVIQGIYPPDKERLGVYVLELQKA